MDSASNYAQMTRLEMSKHLTPPAKRTSGPVYTLAVVVIVFIAAVTADILTADNEPTHQMRRVHVTTTAR